MDKAVHNKIMPVETRSHFEVVTPPEAEPQTNSTTALQVRLLMGEAALSPTVELDAIQREQLGIFEGRDYGFLERFSKRERSSYWTRDSFDEQKQQWVEQTATSISAALNSNATGEQKRFRDTLIRLGITDNKEALANWHKDYFERSPEIPPVKKFAHDVLATYWNSGTLDYDALRKDLPAISWVGNIFGETSSQTLRNMIDAEAQLHTNPDKLINQANAPIQIAGEQKRRSNVFSQEEALLLSRLTNTPVEATWTMPVPPSQEPARDDHNGTEDVHTPIPISYEDHEQHHEDPSINSITTAIEHHPGIAESDHYDEGETEVPHHEEISPHEQKTGSFEEIKAIISSEGFGDSDYRREFKNLLEELQKAPTEERREQILRGIQDMAAGMEAWFTPKSSGNGANEQWRRQQVTYARSLQKEVQRHLNPPPDDTRQEIDQDLVIQDSSILIENRALDTGIDIPPPPPAPVAPSETGEHVREEEDSPEEISSSYIPGLTNTLNNPDFNPEYKKRFEDITKAYSLEMSDEEQLALFNDVHELAVDMANHFRNNTDESSKYQVAMANTIRSRANMHIREIEEKPVYIDPTKPRHPAGDVFARYMVSSSINPTYRSRFQNVLVTMYEGMPKDEEEKALQKLQEIANQMANQFKNPYTMNEKNQHHLSTVIKQRVDEYIQEREDKDNTKSSPEHSLVPVTRDVPTPSTTSNTTVLEPISTTKEENQERKDTILHTMELIGKHIDDPSFDPEFRERFEEIFVSPTADQVDELLRLKAVRDVAEAMSYHTSPQQAAFGHEIFRDVDELIKKLEERESLKEKNISPVLERPSNHTDGTPRSLSESEHPVHISRFTDLIQSVVDEPEFDPSYKSRFMDILDALHENMPEEQERHALQQVIDLSDAMIQHYKNPSLLNRQNQLTIARKIRSVASRSLSQLHESKEFSQERNSSQPTPEIPTNHTYMQGVLNEEEADNETVDKKERKSHDEKRSKRKSKERQREWNN